MPYITSVERIGMEKGQKEGVYAVIHTVVHSAKELSLTLDLAINK